MRFAIIASSLMLLAGCSYIPSVSVPGVYKVDVQQGNVVTSEMLAKLKPGMTKSQVRFALGTPLIADVFHANRWDYAYRFQKAGRLIEQRHVTVVFENDLLKHIEGDVVPAAAPAAAEPAAPVVPAADEAPAAPASETKAE